MEVAATETIDNISEAEAEAVRSLRRRDEAIAAAQAEAELRRCERIQRRDAEKKWLEDRPARWAALPMTVRILLATAERLSVAPAPRSASQALMILARIMLDSEAAVRNMPKTFLEFEGDR
jgi:hypothetical protein